MKRRINHPNTTKSILPKLTCTIRLMILGVLVGFGSLFAHPHGPFEIVTHEHPALGLIISIEDDRITYDVSLSNGFLNTLVPHERGRLKLRLEENTFVFEDPTQEEFERQSLEEFFSNLPSLKIDGVQVSPKFESFRFVRSSASADKRISDTLPPDARIRIQYPTLNSPKNAELTWNVFSDAYSVDAFGDPIKPKLAARLDTNDQSRIISFTKEAPTVRWNAPKETADNRVSTISVESSDVRWGVPVLSLAIMVAGLAGCRLCRKTAHPRRAMGIVLLLTLLAAVQFRSTGRLMLGDPQAAKDAEPFSQVAADIFESLLRNIYRAFDYRSENDVYDVLAQSVDGPLLDAVYKEIHKSLIAANQGGAVTKVKSVEILDAELIDPAQMRNKLFEIKGQWRVDGMVYHWGHVHDTSSLFEAVYTVAPREGFWKIIKTEMKTANPDK